MSTENKTDWEGVAFLIGGFAVLIVLILGVTTCGIKEMEINFEREKLKMEAKP